MIIHNDQGISQISLNDFAAVSQSLNRNLRQNYWKINNIKTEINEISMTKKSKTGINFFSLHGNIKEEEYKKYVDQAHDLLYKFDKEGFTDLVSSSKLSSDTRHFMEGFSYFVFDQVNFVWLRFKKRQEYEKCFIRMRDIRYSKTNTKILNEYGNRYAPEGDFPKRMESTKGMMHLSDWGTAEIMKYIYGVNNKKVVPSAETKKRFNMKNNDSENKTSNQRNKSNTKGNFSQDFNNSVDQGVMLTNLPNIYLHSQSPSKSEASGDYSRSVTDSANKRGYSLERQIMNGRGVKHADPLKTIGHNKQIKGVDYNAIDEKIKRERKVMEYGPGINHRTYGQMRKGYGMTQRREGEKGIDSQHYDVGHNLSAKGITDKEKLFLLLSQNKSSILNVLNEEKIEDLLGITPTGDVKNS